MSDLWLGAFLGLMVYKLAMTVAAAFLANIEKTHHYTHSDTLTELFISVVFGALAMLTYMGVIL